MSTADTLTIALSKGRIFKDTLPLLEHAGIIPQDDPVTSRKLILDTTHADVELVVVRATDVATYVEGGADELGDIRKDVLMEHGCNNLYEPLDLHIAQCRMMVAGFEGADYTGDRVRVATKYVRSAEKFFAARGQQVELIKLYGAMELAPIAGLADVIVDLVESGNTLKANGLVPLEHMHDISSRLIANKASWKMKHARIVELMEQLREAVEKRNG